jgi:hypothetical protein
VILFSSAMRPFGFASLSENRYKSKWMTFS